MRIDVKTAASFLTENDDYLILMHASPDGDTVGCGHALCGALQRLGKNARAVCPDRIPHRFDYMLRAIKPQEFEPKTVVCVDVADSKLLNKMKSVGDTAKLCIDHHQTNTDYAEMTLVDPMCAAAAELVYEVIKAIGVPFEAALADCIYTGVATDTGCFRFSSTTAKTHRIAAEMIDFGADFTRINYVNFDLKTRGRIKLEQTVRENIAYFADGHIALITVPLSLVKSIPDIDEEDVGALADFPRQIEGVDIGICLKEKKNGVFKASLRSSERINAAKICEEFSGGGHARAAGCSFDGGTLADAELKIIKACCKALQEAGIE